MTSNLLAANESSIGTTLAIILGTGMAAQWIAWRTRIPSIILLLSAGLALGPGMGIVVPDELLGINLFPIVSISVALILFEGGLDLPPRELRSAGQVVQRLITLGAIATFAIGAYAATQIIDMDPSAAYVMAAVLIVTGPTVVGPLLRFVRPSGHSGAILRAEGILIDPIGATAALVAFDIAIAQDANEATTRVLWVVGFTLLIGFGIGLAAGWLMSWAMHRFLIPDHLINPIVLALVIVAFVVSNRLQDEAGLLTVTVMGIMLARRESASVRHLLEFNETLRTILISVLFILLAARIQADQLAEVIVPALIFLGVLVFVARPVSVLLSTVFSSTSWRERIFLMAMAPRGIVAAAVSSIFALRLEEEGVRGAENIVPVVFIIIIGTIIVYGFTAGPIARALKLADAHSDGTLIVGAHPVARGFAKEIQRFGFRTVLVDTDPYNVTRAVGAGLSARRMSILSEEAEHKLDLRGVGRLVAMTPNDEVNVLAARRFGRLFGRREAFQLSVSSRRRQVGHHHDASSLPESEMGRLLGRENLDYDELENLNREGWRMRSTVADHRVRSMVESDSFIPLAYVAEDRLHLLSVGAPVPTEGSAIGFASPSAVEKIDHRNEILEKRAEAMSDSNPE